MLRKLFASLLAVAFMASMNPAALADSKSSDSKSDDVSMDSKSDDNSSDDKISGESSSDDDKKKKKHKKKKHQKDKKEHNDNASDRGVEMRNKHSNRANKVAEPNGIQNAADQGKSQQKDNRGFFQRWFGE